MSSKAERKTVEMIARKTRNIVWHGTRTDVVARKIVRKVLREHPEARKAKRPCPVGTCNFETPLVNGTSLWCPKCGLMVPADSIHRFPSGRRVHF
jgi:hypothetical protein